jgi:hypothetical protein
LTFGIVVVVVFDGSYSWNIIYGKSHEGRGIDYSIICILPTLPSIVFSKGWHHTISTSALEKIDTTRGIVCWYL